MIDSGEKELQSFIQILIRKYIMANMCKLNAKKLKKARYLKRENWEKD